MSHTRTPRPYHIAGQRPLSPDSVEIPDEAVTRFLNRLEQADNGCRTLRRLAVGRPITSSRPKSYAKILWNDADGNTHQIRAHRLALMLKLGGPIPVGLQALHRCDNDACVSAAHLYAGTHQDNMDDQKRSRLARARGAVPALHPTRYRPRSHLAHRPVMACTQIRAG